jgi:hypothetical protein
MKKIVWLQIVLAIFFLSFVSLAPAQAANLDNAFRGTINAVAANNYNTNTDIYQIVGTVVQTLLGLLGVIFILLIVYGGVIWMTSEGDEAKVEKAQKILRNAIIGLVITLAAYAISFFIVNALNNITIKK